MQSLGRLVSIRDYETETLAIPGVVAATAAWDLHDGVPAVILRVLLEAGREAEFADVRAAIAHAQRCRGPDRFPLDRASRRCCATCSSTSPMRAIRRYTREDVEAAMRAALGLAGDAANERTGLFGLRARRLGEREYASRIEGRLQNVAGVLWCKVTALGLFAAGVTDPATLALAGRRRARCRRRCPAAPHELLQLAPRASHADRGRRTVGRENAHERADRPAVRSPAGDLPRPRRGAVAAGPAARLSRGGRSARSARSTPTSSSSTTTCSSTPATTGSIPYLADLLGTTHLKGEPRTLRADVADTIALRRRKGTLGAIERLAVNLTGWACRCVELRENLAWSQHLNHQRPDAGGVPPYGDRAR